MAAGCRGSSSAPVQSPAFHQEAFPRLGADGIRSDSAPAAWRHRSWPGPRPRRVDVSERLMVTGSCNTLVYGALGEVIYGFRPAI